MSFLSREMNLGLMQRWCFLSCTVAWRQTGIPILSFPALE